MAWRASAVVALTATMLPLALGISPSPSVSPSGRSAVSGPTAKVSRASPAAPGLAATGPAATVPGPTATAAAPSSAGRPGSVPSWNGRW